MQGWLDSHNWCPLIDQEQQQQNRSKMEQVPCVEHHHEDHPLYPIWFLLKTKGHLWFMWHMWQAEVNWPNYENDPKSRDLFLRQLKSFLCAHNQHHRGNDLVKKYDSYMSRKYYKLGYVFPMIISSEFRMAQYRDDDREEHSTLLKKLTWSTRSSKVDVGKNPVGYVANIPAVWEHVAFTFKGSHA